MSSQIQVVKEKLSQAISQLCETSWMFTKDPARNFTRERKLPLREVISVLLCMEGGNLTGELLRYFGCSQHTVSSSAFIQQRQKINEFAFPSLFDIFIRMTDKDRLYKGYRLLAADGSDIQIPTNPKHEDSYFSGANGQAPYSLLHLDAVYDLLQHTYVDVAVCGRRDWNEKGVFCNMVDRSNIAKALVIADRGYESYNLMAHVQDKSWKYLIRIKDIHSSGIACGLDLPDRDVFDVAIELNLTTRQTKEVKKLCQNRNRYRFVPIGNAFDFLPRENRKHDPVVFYPLPFRIVRFKISDAAYETVVTNLGTEEFPPDELKRLYGMRWGIETSFRELKYTVGLLHFHAKKVENITQEIFARLIMYNFTELITSHVVIQKLNRKYPCKANFSVAVQVCRQFLLGNISPPDVEATISRNVSVTRTGRSNPRNMVVKHAVSFLYRVA